MSKYTKNIYSLILQAQSIESPAIIYSDEMLRQNLVDLIEDIKSARKNKVYLFYSIKACTYSKVIDVIAKYVEGFSVSSVNEYNIVKHYNKKTTGTGFEYKSDFINKLNTFYFNSLSQLKNYLCKQKRISNQKIGVRISAPTTLYLQKQDRKKSRFGININDFDELNRLKDKYNLRIEHLLIHQENKVLNDNKNLKKFLCEILKMKAFNKVKTINLGGGWDNLFLNRAMGEFIDSLDIPQKYKVIVEPGSAVIRTIGILKTSVIDENIIDGVRKVVVNTSQFNNSSWFVPQVIASNTHKFRQRLDTEIYGDTCYEKDFFGIYKNSDIGMNSELIMYPVGAYYYTTHRELHGLKFPREYYLKDES
ncbi:hypothetical protein [Lactobacillus paragasseri]|jgi:diaminopimelate decarboxylase|uniref:Orn/DAP/Arg decarboxylase 2 N-terminal domain-containing protein n=1 Tax=Lactobacillus paragasseri TaxID=2107999 RepID=A0ABD5A0X5_9LACO|nr:hypothetical protein [Lactobacillus paragasseri]MDK7952794.1 hypothetical protein [Lactobacillus paragasseri]MDO6361431.1 hypothetical protein [Lactobacillus paragasseri]MDX5059763.1 hypothetical protein [Lactobacillus paragasseri]